MARTGTQIAEVVNDLSWQGPGQRQSQGATHMSMGDVDLHESGEVDHLIWFSVASIPLAVRA